MHEEPTLGHPDIDVILTEETQLLRDAVDDLDRGMGGMVELTGDPGSGKSHLLADMIRDAEGRGHKVAHIRCAESERSLPFRSFAMLLGDDRMGGFLTRLPDDERQMIARLTMGPHPSGDGRSADLADATASVRLLLEQGSDDRTLLILDDAHWADLASVRLIDDLVRRPVFRPILLVVAHRPRQAPALLRSTLAHGVGLGRVTRIELSPLSREMSARLLGIRTDDFRLPALHRAAEGNPLYLQALAYGGEWRVRGEPVPPTGRLPLRIPMQIADLLIGEVAALDRHDFLVASAAAILGDEGDFDALAAVAELDRDTVVASVDSLVSRDILRATEYKANPSFRHVVLCRVVYDQIDATWRAEAHRRALKVLEGRGIRWAKLACHLQRSLMHAKPEDLHILLRAAEEDLPRDPERAARWLKVALDEFPSGSVEESNRVDVLLMRARGLGLAGSLPECRELLHQIMELLRPGDTTHRASAAVLYGMVACLLGNFAEAQALLQREIDAMLQVPDTPPETAELLIELGVIGFVDGQTGDGGRTGLALDLARRHHDRVVEAGAVILGGLQDVLTCVAAARVALTSAAELVDRLSDADMARHPEYLGMLGWAESLIGRYPQAERHLARGLVVARQHGQGFIVPALLLGLGNVYRHTRHLEDARRLAVEARERAERIRAGHLRGLALVLEALTTAWGTVDGGAAAIEPAEAAVAALGAPGCRWYVTAVVALADAAYLAGDPDRCASVLLEASDRGEPLPPPILRPWSLSAILLASSTSDVPLPVECSFAPGVTGEDDLQAHLGYARLARGLAGHAAGDPGAVADVIQACEHFTTAGMSHVRAWSLTIAARYLAERGERRRASSLLALAKELARRCGGAQALLEAKRQERSLSEAKSPASEEPPANVSAAMSLLTEREREIAAIAATGMRTREIAEELSLSPRTVDVHLTRIYRKLNIDSRTKLVRLMARNA